MSLDARQRHKRVTAAVFGVILIGLGTVFILQNLGMVDAGDIGSWWPVVLVGFGVASLIAPKDPGDAAAGAAMTGLGAFFLLRKLDVIDWRLRDAWPVFLIFAGVALIGRAIAEHRASIPPPERSLENGSAR
jgi:cell wall-active antibiotic response 4TMS protein YvqF